jgi:UDP-N-acetylmuramoylalanine--D-glutamate ligase
MFRGVHVINDNNATTGDAVVAGIRAVAEAYNKKPIVICGGKDKELDVEALTCELGTSTKEVVYLSGSGTDKIHLEKKYEFDRLEDCVATAFSLAKKDDMILFSPGFASFSAYFNNEYERNDCFLEILKKYT